MVSEWKPFNDVSIITYIFPNVPYHYRIHVVNTKISFKLYDFGTAVCKNNSLIKSTKDNKAFVITLIKLVEYILYLIMDFLAFAIALPM